MDGRPRWSYGEEVEWREVWRGRVLGAMPVRVVVDRADLLALYLAEGTPFSFPEQWPWGARHPWERRGRWQGQGTLILHRPGDAYTVWVFWAGPERVFAGWYVNLQEPIRRGARTLETFDHELDVWITPDGAWRYEDDEQLDETVRAGRFSPGEAAEIREVARRVVTELEAGRRWWSDRWATWEPDPSWTR